MPCCRSRYRTRPNPWATTEVEYLEGAPEVKLEVFADHTRQILAKNDSPDVGFTYSVNPYRGCFHACAYCYARPSHEYLSMGAGTDFDRKIVVKLRGRRAAARGVRQEELAQGDASCSAASPTATSRWRRRTG